MMKKCVNRMEELHPHWEVLFYSDGDCEDFVRQQGAGFLELYRWYPRPVQKADFFRILAVWALGGIYLDADVLLSRPLDGLLGHRAVFPWEWKMPERTFEERFPKRSRGKVKPMMVGQYAFGAEAHHPFLQVILEGLVERTASFETDGCTAIDVLHSTGPDLVTSCYYGNPDLWDSLTILPGEADEDAGEAPVTGYGMHHRLGKYGKHLLNGGWK